MEIHNQYNASDIGIRFQRHLRVAIFPVSVSYNCSRTSYKLQQRAARCSTSLQECVYKYLREMKNEDKFMAEIQDIQETNRQIRHMGVKAADFSYLQLCRGLGVDGLIVTELLLPRAIGRKWMTGVVRYVCNKLGLYSYILSLHVFDAHDNKIAWRYRIRDNCPSVSFQPYLEAVIQQECDKLPYIIHSIMKRTCSTKYPRKCPDNYREL
jgi:hypothetical protein